MEKRKKPAPLPAGHVIPDDLKVGQKFYLYGTTVAIVTRTDPKKGAAGTEYELFGKRGPTYVGLPPTREGIGWELAP